MTWLNAKDLEIFWNVARNLATFDYDSASDEDKVENFLESLLERPTLRAYAYKHGISTITNLVEKKLDKPPPKVIKRRIVLWCEHRARESADLETNAILRIL